MIAPRRLPWWKRFPLWVLKMVLEGIDVDVNP
jgi:hypothetical protein